MEAMIFESHAHYDDEQFEEDRTELLNSMQENGIGTDTARAQFLSDGFSQTDHTGF